MQFNFKLQDLNISDIGRWTSVIRWIMSGLLFVFVLFIGYFFVIQAKTIQWDNMVQQEVDLREQYQASYSRLLKLSSYEKEMASLEKKYEMLLKQAPHQPEVTEFLDAVAKLAMENGLKIQSFDPLPMQAKEIYNIQPYRIVVIGDYHQIGSFVTHLAKMERLLTFEIFSVKIIEVENQQPQEIVPTQDLTADLLLYSFFRGKVPDQIGDKGAKK